MKPGVWKLACRTSIACRSGMSTRHSSSARPSIRSSWPLATSAASAVVRGNKAKNAAQPLLVVPEGRRELPEDRAELVAERKDSGGEEVGQRRVHVGQLLQVRDEPRALDREDESVRRLVVPALVRRRPLERVERAVDLDRVQPAGGVLELGPLRQAVRVVHLPPGRVAPPRDPHPVRTVRPPIAHVPIMRCDHPDRRRLTGRVVRRSACLSPTVPSTRCSRVACGC